MNYAHEHQKFKDAINEYVHIRIAQLNKFGDGLDDIEPTFCAIHPDAVIYDVWDSCLTENDREEIRGKYSDDSILTIKEIEYLRRGFFDAQRIQEMENQINLLRDERSRGENEQATTNFGAGRV